MVRVTKRFRWAGTVQVGGWLIGDDHDDDDRQVPAAAHDAGRCQVVQTERLSRQCRRFGSGSGPQAAGPPFCKTHAPRPDRTQHHARAVVSNDAIDAFAPVRVVERDEHVEVTLEGPRGPVEVWLRETYSEPIFTMCRAHAPDPVRQW
ncbi:hypothetical protein GCM10009831_19540 [Dietzia cercidiphylli]|uniref:Uncharacterized protein n=1 Tax=Dietzia cercidiphylli TaxID=498199 RepID=A0ABP4UTP9_9ACTN